MRNNMLDLERVLLRSDRQGTLSDAMPPVHLSHASRLKRKPMPSSTVLRYLHRRGRGVVL